MVEGVHVAMLKVNGGKDNTRQCILDNIGKKVSQTLTCPGNRSTGDGIIESCQYIAAS